MLHVCLFAHFMRRFRGAPDLRQCMVWCVTPLVSGCCMDCTVLPPTPPPPFHPFVTAATAPSESSVESTARSQHQDASGAVPASPRWQRVDVQHGQCGECIAAAWCHWRVDFTATTNTTLSDTHTHG